MSQRALPDLVAKLKLDTTSYIEGVKLTSAHGALFDEQAKKITASLGALERAHGTAGNGARAHATQITALEKSIKSADSASKAFTRSLESMGGTADTRVGRVANTLGSALGGAGPVGMAAGIGLGGVAAGAGALAVLEHMADAQANLGFKTLQASQALEIQTDKYQGLVHWGERYNIDQETMDVQLSRFNKNLADGAPNLQKIGLSTQQLGITAHDTYTAYGQAADAISKMDDAQQKAAVTQALFGKGGESQIEALQAGSKAIDDYTQKLKDYGVILDNDQLKTAAMAKVTHEDLGLALKGLETQFVAPLEGGFAELEMVMSHAAQSGKSGFAQVGQAIGTVIGELASFLNGFFNLGLTQKDFAGVAKEAATGLKNQGAGFAATIPPAKDYEAQIKALRQTTQDQTQALAEEVKGLENRKAAMAQAIDDTIRAYQEDQKALDIKLQLMQVNRTLADDERKLAKDTSDLKVAQFEGDYTKQVQFSDQLTNDKQKAADDQMKAGIDATKRELQEKIDAENEVKRVKTAAFDSQIKQIQDTSTALQRQAQDQEQRLSDLAAASKLPGQDFADSSMAGFSSAGIALDSFTLKFDAGAKHWGDTIRGALGGDEKSKKELEKLADQLGQDIGNAIGKGVGWALGHIDWGKVILGAISLPDTMAKGLTKGIAVDIISALPGQSRDKVQASADHGALGAILDHLPPIPGIPGLAGGGTMQLGDTAKLVGEIGPELLELTPRGARVTPLSGGAGAAATSMSVQLVFPGYIGDRRDLEAAMRPAAEAAFGELLRRR